MILLAKESDEIFPKLLQKFQKIGQVVKKVKDFWKNNVQAGSLANFDQILNISSHEPASS